MKVSTIFVAVLWVSLGSIAYMGEMAHSKIDPYPDQLCRSVNHASVCDDRLMVKRSFFMILGVAGGPISFVATAAFTGFYHAGLSL